MDSKERLTHERVNGIKHGYWSAANKQQLIDRLAKYENLGFLPEDLNDLVCKYLAYLAEDKKATAQAWGRINKSKGENENEEV